MVSTRIEGSNSPWLHTKNSVLLWMDFLVYLVYLLSPSISCPTEIRAANLGGCDDLKKLVNISIATSAKIYPQSAIDLIYVYGMMIMSTTDSIVTPKVRD